MYTPNTGYRQRNDPIWVLFALNYGRIEDKHETVNTNRVWGSPLDAVHPKPISFWKRKGVSYVQFTGSRVFNLCSVNKLSEREDFTCGLYDAMTSRGIFRNRRFTSKVSGSSSIGVTILVWWYFDILWCECDLSKEGSNFCCVIVVLESWYSMT